MKKAALCLLCCLLLAGCTPPSDPNVDVPRPSSSSPSDGRDAIPFGEGELYAAAYLGYLEMEDLDFYQARYLDGREPPVHYFSAGEFYLVIPRYEGTALSLYHNDINTLSQSPELVFHACSAIDWGNLYFLIPFEAYYLFRYLDGKLPGRA